MALGTFYVVTNSDWLTIKDTREEAIDTADLAFGIHGSRRGDMVVIEVTETEAECGNYRVESCIIWRNNVECVEGQACLTDEPTH